MSCKYVSENIYNRKIYWRKLKYFFLSIIKHKMTFYRNDTILKCFLHLKS